MTTKKTKSTKKPASTKAKKPTSTKTKKPTSTKAKPKASAKKSTSNKKAQLKPKGSAASSRSKSKTSTRANAKRSTPSSTKKNYSSKDVTLIKTTLKETKVPSIRRPATNPSMPSDNVSEISEMFNQIRAMLEDYAANLRPLDRRRHKKTRFHRARL